MKCLLASMLSVFCFFLFVQPVLGKTIYVDFRVINGSSIIINHLEYNEKGEPTRTPSSGNYSVQLLDELDTVMSSFSFQPAYYVYVDPGGRIPVETSEVAVELKYYSTVRYLVFRDSDKELLRVNLTDYLDKLGCDSDGFCEVDESVVSCPEDCDPKEDGMCTPFFDGVCDPQCPKEEDIDCTPRKKPKSLSEVLKEINSEWTRDKIEEAMTQLFLFSIPIGLILIYIYVKHIRPKRRW